MAKRQKKDGGKVMSEEALEAGIQGWRDLGLADVYLPEKDRHARE